MWCRFDEMVAFMHLDGDQSSLMKARDMFDRHNHTDEHEGGLDMFEFKALIVEMGLADKKKTAKSMHA